MQKDLSYFSKVPSGFLFRDWTGTVREGSIVDQTPNGEYVKIEDSQGANLGWYEVETIEFLYKPNSKR